MMMLSACLQVSVGHAVITFNVNSIADLADDGAMPGICHTTANSCTLRAAIMQANKVNGDVTIMVPAGRYELTIPAVAGDAEATGDLNLTSPAAGSPLIDIIGSGAASTLIDGKGINRIFRIHAGRRARISGVTIQNGKTADGDGAGILNEGSLKLLGSIVTGNRAFRIHPPATALTFAFGGGVFNSGVLEVVESTISVNIADGDIGGLGGGIFNYHTGNLTITSSTINENFSTLNAGGILNGGVLTVMNSTISGNRTRGAGGGIFSSGTTAVGNLYNTTIVFNRAAAEAANNTSAGGGVYISAGTANFRNALIAGNTRAAGTINDDCSGPLGSYGRNVMFITTGCTITGPGPMATLTTLAAVGPLRNNGGPTFTHALVNGVTNEAIDGGDPVQGCIGFTSQPLATDQRGVVRSMGVRCDLGAVEFNPNPFDIDKNGKHDALTDGLMAIRYLLGVTGSAVSSGALGTGATRTAAEIPAYLDTVRSQLDIDGNGSAEALTDGVLLLRYLFGLRGDNLIANAVDPSGQRKTAAQIQQFIQALSVP